MIDIILNAGFYINCTNKRSCIMLVSDAGLMHLIMNGSEPNRLPIRIFAKESYVIHLFAAKSVTNEALDISVYLRNDKLTLHLF